ncbi:MAG TPA: baseplate J/gp47 family protein [bacterium]|nr:baseplate J/gp47 family protein [bacterium]
MANIIYIEADEKSTAIAKKILSDKSKTIKLAIPKKATAFSESVLLTLFKKLSKTNKNITIISNDNDGLKIAQKIGFNVESTNPAAIKKDSSSKIKIVYKQTAKPKSAPLAKKNIQVTEKSDLDTANNPPTEKPNLFTQILFTAISILSIIIIVSVILLIVPSTTIDITTQVDSTPFSQNVKLDTTQKNIDFINNTIPAQSITIEEELKQEARATGQTNHGEKSSGKITVFNQASADVPLIANTRFSSPDGIIYRSTNSVNIPGGGSSDVFVTCDQIGTIGNIGPSRFTLPALSGSDYIYGQSSSSMSGGTDDITYTITADDMKFSEDEIKQKIYDQAIQDLLNKLPANKKYFSDPYQQIVLNTNADKQVGDEVDTFNIVAKSSITFLVYDEKDLEDLVANSLSKSLAKERVYVNNGLSELSTQTVSTNISAGNAELKISTTALSAPIYNTDVIKKEISGKNAEQVKEYFLQYPEIQQIDIKFWPDWVKRVSSIPSRISIDISW